jgi:hypothetical protein
MSCPASTKIATQEIIVHGNRVEDVVSAIADRTAVFVPDIDILTAIAKGGSDSGCEARLAMNSLS